MREQDSIKSPHISVAFFAKLILSPFKWYCIFLFSFAFVWAFDTALRPYLIKLIVDRLSATPPSYAFDALKGPLFLFVLLSLVILGGYRFYDFLLIRVLPPVRQRVIDFLMTHLVHHSHTYFQNNFAGALGTRVSEVANGLRELITIFVDRFVANGLAVTLAIIAISFIHWSLAVILLGWLMLFLTVSLYTSKHAYDLSSRLSEATSFVVGKIVDTLSNMSVVRLFTGERHEKKNLVAFTNESIHREERLLWFLFKIWLFQGLSFLVTEMLCILVLINGFERGTVTIGDFGFVLTLYLQLTGSLWNLSKDFSDFSEHLGRIAEGLSIIMKPHEIVDHPGARKLVVKRGEITFDHVLFHYKTETPLFQNLSVTIKGGEKVGLVGYSGSGKTTFANLIARLYDVQGGRILIDGMSIAEVTVGSLRQNLSMIPQDPTLFHRSILENIRYGTIDASDENVIEAAKCAHVHDFVETFPEGYHTTVGERGVKMSGGQRQRIAIARALLKNAPILILDEATSALDSITEKYIQEALETLMHNKTTIVIAHRLSTLLSMDRILVFDRGQIIEDGTHRALLQSKGMYARLWQAQESGFLVDGA